MSREACDYHRVCVCVTLVFGSFDIFTTYQEIYSVCIYDSIKKKSNNKIEIIILFFIIAILYTVTEKKNNLNLCECALLMSSNIYANYYAQLSNYLKDIYFS